MVVAAAMRVPGARVVLAAGAAMARASAGSPGFAAAPVPARGDAAMASARAATVPTLRGAAAVHDLDAFLAAGLRSTRSSSLRRVLVAAAVRAWQRASGCAARKGAGHDERRARLRN